MTAFQDGSPPAEPSQFGPARFFNRELSWIAFNHRVLDEACNDRHPLLERLRFLAISAANLDEFIVVRVAGLKGQVRRGIDELSNDGCTPAQQLVAIDAAIARLRVRQQRVLLALRRPLAAAGIALTTTRLTRSDLAWLETYFREQIFPVITPQALDPAHPFPFIANQGMGLLFRLEREEGAASVIEMILVPATLPRLIRLPGAEARYVSLEETIRRFAPLIFPGFAVRGSGLFRLLRDSDIEIEEDAEDLVRHYRTAIQRRRRGKVIWLEIEARCDPALEELLLRSIGTREATVARVRGLLDLSAFGPVIDVQDRPDLHFPPHSPRYPERIAEHDGDCFAAIREKDFIVQHPYETFEVVLDFLKQAGADPDVVAIKQTLYRAGKQPAVIDALIAAAEAGKAVTAVVELRARFDEEQNLLWAAQLERAGVQVIYGFVDYKTHAKMSLVIRREGNGFATYCHFGTGNYHPVTARIYTDLSYFTADPELANDAAQVFNFITGYVTPHTSPSLAVSPVNLRERLTGLIDSEIASAEAGRPSGIWAKLNSLTDSRLIDRLYAASNAGVPIDLVVRGICALRPGVAGLSENIRVKSIVGRFLEHSRIWAFGNGEALPSASAAVFISSADGMTRNLDRRVECLVRIKNPTVHSQVLDQVLVANLLDTEQSWRLASDGSYTRFALDGRTFNLHRYFMTNPSLSGRGTALHGVGDVPSLAERLGPSSPAK
ncbi:RNA degradosome polyphosphate kinase [Novosphingobium tardum]|uniref:Polyphosphate kinase n=1 Tax=Novosphingobium tardum TaxID=1538021 RepID=A0ABV8RNZ8_9SPHN